MDSQAAKEKKRNHTGVGSWFSVLKPACNSFVTNERIVWISLEGLLSTLKVWSRNSFVKIASKWGDMVECERFKVIVQGKVHWIRAKEMDAWSPFFHEGTTNSSTNEDSEGDETRSFCGTKNDIDCNLERESGEHSKEEDLTHPPGFTPNIENREEEYAKEGGVNEEEAYVRVKSISSKLNKSLSQASIFLTSTNGSHTMKSGGSFLQVMDEIVKVGQTIGYNMEGVGHKAKKGWIKELCLKHRVDFLALQETKIEQMELFTIKDLWANFTFDYACSPSIGNSGGILCVWDPRLFVKDNVLSSDYFLAVIGTWTPTSTKLLIISVYAPQKLTEKRELWDYIRLLIDRWEGEYVILGYFNEVRLESKRLGSLFNVQGANAFNNFISMASLIDLSLEGYAFTWAHKSANKMSKLDRFLISQGLLSLFPHLSALCLDRHLSYHHPILMRELNYDYGPTLFKIFHFWFAMEGFNKFVEETWAKTTNQKKLFEIDKIMDQGGSNEDILNSRTILLKELHDINKVEYMEMAQRAKIRWAIEGDENSKYFHGILNQKRSQMAIRGILVDDHMQDLERNISQDEVKRAVWDCGMNKTPGSDGFTFEFIRRD
nr:RNA-directed DNA polymerase, eukaryota [Tanacetum cinerariifolium]